MATTTRKRATKKTAAPPTGKDRVPKRSQGWYRDPETGAKLRSVTTILNQGVPKEDLTYWAGNITAQTAMEHLPEMVAASRSRAKRDAFYAWLRKAPERKRDERADLGTAVHKLIEAHVLGQPIPDELLNDPEMAPYLEQFLAFVRDYDVRFEASEMVVANEEDGYAGTLDFLAASESIVDILIEQELLDEGADHSMALMGDTKSGGEICLGVDDLCVQVRPYVFKNCPGRPHQIKGVYPEAGMQMSAYRAARVAWLRDGSKVAMPATHPIGIVLHLRPNYYLVHPIVCGDDVFTHFQHARNVAEWTSQTSKTVLGEPLIPNTDTRKAA